ncbi:MAG TPA: hypothetical protein VD846_07200 [Allosphingosinicella sp.]|nr:hypothetical protein [Allosphingosinicella sp.]
MEIRKVQAAAMRQRARSLREAACDFSSGVSRTLIELAEVIEAEAARLEAKGD